MPAGSGGLTGDIEMEESRIGVIDTSVPTNDTTMLLCQSDESERSTKIEADLPTIQPEASTAPLKVHHNLRSASAPYPLPLSSPLSSETDDPPSPTGNGKGKANANKTQNNESGDEYGGCKKKQKEKEKKKVLYAKEVYWTDIPDWGERTDCPLMELPSEILDRCFGFREVMRWADYVSLAGVSPFFRHHLDDSFFEVLHNGNGLSTSVSAVKIKRSTAPFSHSVADWRKIPEPTRVAQIGVRDHYIPKGDRSTWKRNQYEVYKEEKAAWKQQQRAVRNAQMAEVELKAAEARRVAAQRGKTIMDGSLYRSVLATIPGRRHGEQAVTKDDRGLPLKDQASPDMNNGGDHNEPDCRLKKTAGILPTLAICSYPVYIDQQAASIRETSRSDTSEIRLKKKRRTTQHSEGRAHGLWTAPETDSESEADLMVKYDKDGRRILHDYWPSLWRSRVAGLVNSNRITKSNALKDFKVAESELITLQHVLTYNPMNSKSPKQLFLLSPVLSLAFKAHGGVLGHEDHLSIRKVRAAKCAATREAKIEKAKADGTYVQPRLRAAPYLWGYEYDLLYNEYDELYDSDAFPLY